MNENENQVADSLDKAGVEEFDAQTGGVSTPAPEPSQRTQGQEQEMATQETSDAGEWETKLAQVKSQYEQDMSRLRSSLQKNAAQERQEYEQRMTQLEQDLYAARTATMNDQERIAYERDLYAQKAQTLEDRYNQVQQRLYETENMGQAARAFQQLGIKADKLDTSSMENLLETGWRGVAERIAELETSARTPAPRISEDQVRQEPTKPEPGPVKPPATASAQGVSTGGRTWGEALKAASDVLGRPVENDEDLWREVELGHLPPSIIPGLG